MSVAAGHSHRGVVRGQLEVSPPSEPARRAFAKYCAIHHRYHHRVPWGKPPGLLGRKACQTEHPKMRMQIRSFYPGVQAVGYGEFDAVRD